MKEDESMITRWPSRYHSRGRSCCRLFVEAAAKLQPQFFFCHFLFLSFFFFFRPTQSVSQSNSHFKYSQVLKRQLAASCSGLSSSRIFFPSSSHACRRRSYTDATPVLDILSLFWWHNCLSVFPLVFCQLLFQSCLSHPSIKAYDS